MRQPNRSGINLTAWEYSTCTQVPESMIYDV